MGKRSKFERVERDFYPTPLSAVLPLLPHLAPNTRFVEPCAGNGALVDHLTAAGHVCASAFDIDPQRADIGLADALEWTAKRYAPADTIITNPPWLRETLHAMIVHFSAQRPTWLLFDADWVHTKQAIPYLPRLRKVVSVGRVKWIPDSKFTGKDNCAWHLFEADVDSATILIGRAA